MACLPFFLDESRQEKLVATRLVTEAMFKAFHDTETAHLPKFSKKLEYMRELGWTEGRREHCC